jgi:hypothetical protein
MNTEATTIERIQAPCAQQLTLLTVPETTPSDDAELKPSSAHLRFQLSKAARARGLEHVAEIRRQLAESRAARESAVERRLPPRNNVAA